METKKGKLKIKWRMGVAVQVCAGFATATVLVAIASSGWIPFQAPKDVPIFADQVMGSGRSGTRLSANPATNQIKDELGNIMELTGGWHISEQKGVATLEPTARAPQTDDSCNDPAIREVENRFLTELENRNPGNVAPDVNSIESLIAPTLSTPVGPSVGETALVDARSTDATGFTGNSTVPAGQQGPANTHVKTFLEVENAAEISQGTTLLEAALGRRNEIQSAAQYDTEVLARNYENLSLSEMASAFSQARRGLGETAEKIARSTSGLLPGEKKRFENAYRNAADKAAAAGEIIREEQAKAQLSKYNLWENLLPEGVKKANPLAKSAALADLFGPALDMMNPTSEDALTDRMIMHQGLAKKERSLASEQMALMHSPALKFQDGSTENVDILHNGYILGGGSELATDCSSFISSLVSAEGLSIRFNTLDFRQMHQYARTGKFPHPPRYAPDRARKIRQAASSFKPVEIYQGEPLIPGDLLFYRVPTETAGHIVIVRKYNSKTGKLTFVDASQSAGTVREKTVTVASPYKESDQLYFYPGFRALRMKAQNNRACNYASM